MAIVSLTALALAATAMAQGSQTQVTWASVVYTYHGERIPFLHGGPYNLTPLGAQQALNAGQVIRDRYISAPANGTQLTTAMPINGLSVNDINNSQMEVLSLSDEYITASALAFMQGLYPQRSTSSEVVDEESILGNGSLVQFPLEGYQYPNLGTVSTLDFNYIWLGGNIGCTNYSINQVNTLASQSFTNIMTANEGFYQSLAPSVFWSFDPSIVNLGNAYTLYEYALFQYTHNKTVYESLSTANLTHLRTLASYQQWLFNTPPSASTNNVNAIAGQTLATHMFTQLSKNIASGGTSDKLSLLFGSFQPMLSFFALSGLSKGRSASSFQGLPKYGSSMSFELFSYVPRRQGRNLTVTFPDTQDLWVRFLFRNGTSDTDPMVAYPLFGRGNSEVDMSWKDFAAGISTFAVDDVSEWCNSCNSVNLFCQAIESNMKNSSSTTIGGSSSKGLPAWAAGLIGATVVLGLFIIGAVALCLLGFRVDQREKKNSGSGSANGDISVLKRSGSGGFKGAEKLASDTDLALKTGAGATVIRHERVGSWELNESPVSPGTRTHGSLDKEVESERVVSGADYSRRSEDGLGEHPVKPVEHV
ncbi:histidine acid phosphatase-like protein [Tricladium varicosporioides]|nr:histidine acid phosphatase-like protein [Hymenoscyphus varicosporioides]